MASLNVRQLRSTFASTSENENPSMAAKAAGKAAPLTGKALTGKAPAAGAGAGAGAGALKSGRSALGNIGNNLRTTRGGGGQQLQQASKEPVKPARGLTKQKATSTLQVRKQRKAERGMRGSRLECRGLTFGHYFLLSRV